MNEKALEAVKNALEKKYPNHNFNWKYKSNRYWGLCPEHEDKEHPNLNIFVPKGENYAVAHCFACGFTFTPNSFSRQVEEALKICRDYLKDSFSLFTSSAAEYLKKRLDPHIDSACTINKLVSMGIGLLNKSVCREILAILPESVKKEIEKYCSGEFLVFEYRNLNQSVSFLHLREPYTKNFATVQIRKSETAFFNIPAVIESDAPFVILTEGEFDAITPSVATDFYIPIASLGSAGRFNLQVVEELKKLNKIPVLSPDWDRAGIEVLKRLKKPLVFM